MNTKEYYKKVLGGYSLYFWAELLGLNSYQFDAIKRLIRKKGNWKADVDKTVMVLDIWLMEGAFNPNPKRFHKDYNKEVKSFIETLEKGGVHKEVIRVIELIINSTNTRVKREWKNRLTVLKRLVKDLEIKLL